MISVPMHPKVRIHMGTFEALEISLLLVISS